MTKGLTLQTTIVINFTYLQTEQYRPSFKRIMIFPGGAPTQYKNKASFMDLTYFEEDFAIPIEKHFFGTRHGKGLYDRVL